MTVDEESPSSRRAWIEISQCFSAFPHVGVALLAEGVDRNLKKNCISPAPQVALLAEGVDRNVELPLELSFARRRPPRGGRG